MNQNDHFLLSLTTTAIADKNNNRAWANPTYKQVNINTDDFISYLSRGYAFTHLFNHNGDTFKTERKNANFVGSQVITIDFDNAGVTYEGFCYIMENSSIQPTITYTTQNNLIKGNRYRALYILDSVVEWEMYDTLFRSICREINGYCGIEYDKQSHGRNHQFAGNATDNFEYEVGHVFKVCDLCKRYGVVTEEPAPHRANSHATEGTQTAQTTQREQQPTMIATEPQRTNNNDSSHEVSHRDTTLTARQRALIVMMTKTNRGQTTKVNGGDSVNHAHDHDICHDHDNDHDHCQDTMYHDTLICHDSTTSIRVNGTNELHPTSMIDFIKDFARCGYLHKAVLKKVQDDYIYKTSMNLYNRGGVIYDRFALLQDIYNNTFIKDFYKTTNFTDLLADYVSIFRDVQVTDVPHDTTKETYNIPKDYMMITRKWIVTEREDGRTTRQAVKIHNGEGRRCHLFMNLIVRRLIWREIPFENLLYNAIFEVVNHIDNTDMTDVITKKQLAQIVVDAYFTDLSKYSKLVDNPTFKRPKYKVCAEYCRDNGVSKREVQRKMLVQQAKQRKAATATAIKQYYNPTWTDAENLNELHEKGVNVSLRTLKSWKREAGYTKPRKAKSAKVSDTANNAKSDHDSTEIEQSPTTIATEPQRANHADTTATTTAIAIPQSHNADSSHEDSDSDRVSKKNSIFETAEKIQNCNKLNISNLTTMNKKFK